MDVGKKGYRSRVAQILSEKFRLYCGKISSVKPRPNDRNISTHTFRNTVGRNMFGHPVARCCDKLGVVGLKLLKFGINLKLVKLFMQHLWMLHDVVVVWPGCTRACAQRDFQYPTCRTHRNIVAKRAQQCCDMLC